ncbi:MAG TPA: tetratricopeptide repeat protein [Allosphingosinicella sp.]|uniref:tetratricopeptide repeat protein n=1 Tax=Allosphingosinicella sp. TaxID=2823234 RepID=UPI002F272615
MAIKPRDNESFYREVDEELRKEQLTNVWKRYGFLIGGGVLLLLAAIAGYLWWQQRQQAEAGERGERLVAAFEDVQAGRSKAANPKLDQLAAEDSDGIRAAALITKADLAIQDGNLPAAVAAFKSVADNQEFAEPYRQLALIRQTTIEFDRIAPAEVIRRLSPLAVAGGPWFGSAGELVAIAHMKEGQQAQAAPIFAALAKDEKLPSSIRSRAVQMAGALGIDAVQATDIAGAGAAATKE